MNDEMFLSNGQVCTEEREGMTLTVGNLIYAVRYMIQYDILREGPSKNISVNCYLHHTEFSRWHVYPITPCAQWTPRSEIIFLPVW